MIQKKRIIESKDASLSLDLRELYIGNRKETRERGNLSCWVSLVRVICKKMGGEYKDVYICD